LTLRSDGRRKYFEWGIVSEIAGSKADVPDWWQTGYVPDNSLDVGFEPLPVTVPMSRPAPEGLSRDEALRRLPLLKSGRLRSRCLMFRSSLSRLLTR